MKRPRSKLTVSCLEGVENGKELAVVGDKSLANQWCRHNKLLKDLKGVDENFLIARV
jgi:hypothetical protein